MTADNSLCLPGGSPQTLTAPVGGGSASTDVVVGAGATCRITIEETHRLGWQAQPGQTVEVQPFEDLVVVEFVNTRQSVEIDPTPTPDSGTPDSGTPDLTPDAPGPSPSVPRPSPTSFAPRTYPAPKPAFAG